ncbi:MAG TPA: recombination regulator RecX [Burkholderiales bacterium]|nr:recombination regulator RecX [Burkholderiales bacterium]
MRQPLPASAAELKTRALRLLARREHSRTELARKLAPHAESREALQGLLDELERKKQLSDERYAETRVHQLARKYGPARIVQDLRAKGVAEETVESLATGARADELERARAILARKYRAPADTPEERARRARFLQSRGFSTEVIRRLVIMA